MFQYMATVFRIVDGDTIEMIIDLGFRMTYKANVRISGINAPEMPTPEGQASKAFLATYLPLQSKGILTSHSLDKYGRVLGDFLAEGSQHTVGAVMLLARHAVKA